MYITVHFRISKHWKHLIQDDALWSFCVPRGSTRCQSRRQCLFRGSGCTAANKYVRVTLKIISIWNAFLSFFLLLILVFCFFFWRLYQPHVATTSLVELPARSNWADQQQNCHIASFSLRKRLPPVGANMKASSSSKRMVRKCPTALEPNSQIQRRETYIHRIFRERRRERLLALTSC